MKKARYIKGIIICIIVLFIGVSITPGICGSFSIEYRIEVDEKNRMKIFHLMNKFLALHR